MDSNLIDLIERAVKGRWTILDISGRNLQTLPPDIGRLTKLRTLNASNGQLIALPPDFWKLNHLKDLDLSNNNLYELSAAISNLNKLRTLNLNSNQLSELPVEIGHLIRLRTLHIGHNSLGSLTSEIMLLTELESIDLSGNRLLTIPEEIGNLTDLKSANFSDNPIGTLPREVSNLTKLRVLSIRNAGLTSLPPDLADIPKLRYLELEGNPLVSPPPEVVQQGASAILAFLRNLQAAESQRFEAKVLLLGQGGVGKTSILGNLRELSFAGNQDTTRGVDVALVQLPHPERVDVMLKLNVWDFAGQEIEHATHQFFMSSKSVYVLVWNARHGYVQGRLDYWLEMIKSRAPETPVLLVATHIDQRLPDINFGALQQTYPQLVGQCAVDNESGTGIDELRREIARWAAALPLMGQPWPENWQAVEDDLKLLTAHHIPYRHFEEICKKHQLASQRDIGALAETLHNLGMILHFPSEAELRDLVILKPNWITKAMSYALTDIPTGRAYGRLDHEALPRIWHNYDQSLYPAFFSLMNKFELCYQIEDVDDLSLIPALLSYMPPETPVIKPKLTMIYRLSSVPPGLMSRFIVRTHRFTGNMHWREGVVLMYDGQTARAELFEHPREFHLTLDGSSPTYFFAVLMDTLNQIFASFPGLGVERRIPCICQNDGLQEKPCEYMFLYEDLVRRKEKGKETIECNISLEEVSLNKLLYGIHDSSRAQISNQVISVREEPDEGYRQAILLGQRGIVHVYNRAQSVDSRCPALFVLFRETAKKLVLRLICQSPDGWHLASRAAAYTIDNTEQRRTLLARLLYEALPLLGHVIPLSGLSVNLRSKSSRSDRKSLEEAIGFMNELVSSTVVEQGLSLGNALRQFSILLEDLDRSRTYGGLRTMTTPDGSRRWLCPFHYAEFQPASLQPHSRQFDVFLCHNSANKAIIREIAGDFRQRGLRYWFDEEQMLGGDRWQDVLSKALRETHSTIVCVGEDGWGDWQLEELHVALNLSAGRGRHRIIPLLLPPLVELPDDFPAFLKTRHAVTLKSASDAEGLAVLERSIRAGQIDSD